MAEKKEVLNNTHLLTKYGGSIYVPLTRYMKANGMNPKNRDPVKVSVVNNMIIIHENEFTDDQFDSLRKI